MSSYKPAVSAVTIKNPEHVKQLDTLCEMAGLSRADALGHLMTIMFRNGIDKRLKDAFNIAHNAFEAAEQDLQSNIEKIEPFPALKAAAKKPKASKPKKPKTAPEPVSEPVADTEAAA